ncbi:MAG: ModE family transcriptional regulator [Halarcobacter sp.]
MKNNLMQHEKSMILENVNEKGKLPCIKALQIAKSLKIDPKSMLKITDELKIKIGQCELGVFGDKELGEVDKELYKKIVSYGDDNKKVECIKLWEEAKLSSMKKVRSTVNQTDLFVTYCQLGCFEEGRKKWKQK